MTMGEQQRIYPIVDLEAAPRAPLVPRGVFRSEKGDPVHYNASVPEIRPVPPKRSCCCKCLCWTISILILLLISIGITCGILYYIFRPKVPNYAIDKLKITKFGLNYDATLYAEFHVRITARNPNEKIGIFYEKGGQLSVWFTDTQLCEGYLPRFYQGHRNTTVLDVTLSGETESGGTLMKALQEQQQTGSIPLDLKVDVPVAVKVGKLKLKKVRFLVGCNLVVDSLTANNLISIKTSNCRFNLNL